MASSDFFYTYPSSKIGQQLREEEVLRQTAPKNLPEKSDTYLNSVSYHDLSNEEKNRLHEGFAERVETESSRKALPDRPLFLQELEVYTRTAYGIYGVCEKPAPELPRELPLCPSPKLLPLQMHEKDIQDLETVGDFHGTPIKGGDLEHLLGTRQEMAIARNLSASKGNSYPSLVEMEILSAHETVGSKNIIRVGRANTPAEPSAILAKLLQTKSAEKDTDEGKMILWNAGGTGKNSIIDYTDQEEV